MASRQFIDAKWLERLATATALSAALVGAFMTEAAAEPRAGAPIVFAGQRPSARPTPVRVTEALARFQPVSATASARRAPPVSTDQPDVLYGYGSNRARTNAPVIDLRGTLASAQQSDSLGDDAFDNGYETVSAANTQEPHTPDARRDAAPVATAAPGQRPAWLEQERTGAPYQANGQWFVPTAEPNYAETGSASWYGNEFHGRRTASGEIFDSEALTAAHPTLPIPSLVQVTNLENGREVIVRVNDRGPFHGERLIDVSRRTADVLGFERQGQARVHVRYLGPAPKLVAAEAAGASAAGAVDALASVPAPVVTAPARAEAGAYVVQVGAFANVANAERAREALRGTGEVMVDVRQSGGASLHRVRVGAWPTSSAAEAARAAVAELGYPGAVVATAR